MPPKITYTIISTPTTTRATLWSRPDSGFDELAGADHLRHQVKADHGQRLTAAMVRTGPWEGGRR